MACTECNNNCNETTPQCSCAVKDLSTDCVKYTGQDLECSGIISGNLLTDVIIQLDKFICNKFNDVIQYLTLGNVGSGAQVYKGIAGNGTREFRTISKLGNLITIEQLNNEVQLSIDESNLQDFIQNEFPNLLNYECNNVGDGVAIFRDSTQVGNTITHNFRTLESNTLTIQQVNDKITIESGLPDLGGVRDFIVNTRYTGDEELGTIAKPYKTLDDAITDYIGTGSNLTPQFSGSRILCTGGQSHNFTQSLSINNLILEVEAGTTIRYTGVDLYPIDFRPLQINSGGYSTQTRDLIITLRGEGTIISNKLLAYVVNSGHTSASPNRFRNILTVSNLTLRSEYKKDEFISGITRSDGSPWVSNTREVRFYFGTINEPVIVFEGQNNIIDNSLNPLGVFRSISLNSISQQSLLIDGARCILEDCRVAHGFSDGINSFIIADDTALVGTVLTESPLLTYNLPNSKPNLSLVEVRGNGGVSIIRGLLATGFEITSFEAWYKLTSSSSSMSIEGANNISLNGGILADNFIETGIFNPSITITNTNVFRDVSTGGSLINTSVNPYAQATIDNNKFPFSISDNIDLTRSNSISVVNVFKNSVKESLRKFSSRAAALSAGLSSGDIFVKRVTVNAGNFIIGETYVINVVGDTDFTLIGASSNTPGQYFTATGVGAGTGNAYLYNRDILL